MKMLFMVFTVLILNQNVFATGDMSENKYESAPKSENESGSTFTAAVSKDGQPAYCEKCESNSDAMLSNSVGVLNSANSSTVTAPKSSEPVKSGK